MNRTKGRKKGKHNVLSMEKGNDSIELKFRLLEALRKEEENRE